MSTSLGSPSLQEPHPGPSERPCPGTVLWCTQQVPSPAVTTLVPSPHKLTVTVHRSRRAPLPSEASVATSLISSSSLVRSQIFKLTSSQGEQALLRPPVSAGHCQTKEPAWGDAGRWPGEACLLFSPAFS